MSADEDTELRDLVAQSLETNGTLGKIRAQLRASVFLALEEQESVQNKTPFLNKDLKQFLSTREGRQVTCLVREFLECFNLEFTLAVFDPETGLGPDYDRRDKLVCDLSLDDEGGPSSKAPLLSEVLRLSQTGGRKFADSSNKSTKHGADDMPCFPKDLSEKQLAAAQEKFDYYDKDGSGSIDKDELRDLFMDLFPHFHRNMLDRYVNDEFKAVDRNFSSSIDFDEFVGMYKRLFLLCRSVVSGEPDDSLTSSHRKDRAPPFASTSSKSSNYAENKNYTNTLEAKNQRNLDNHKQPSSEASNGPRQNSLIDLSSDVEGDPFFDDPVPASGSLNLSNRSISPVSNSRRSSPGRPSQIPVYVSGRQSDDKKLSNPQKSTGAGSGGRGSNMSSLQGLPSLTPEKAGSGQTQGTAASKSELDGNLRSLDKRMAELPLSDGQDDFEYEDDFQDSVHSTSAKSPRLKSDNRSMNENGGGSIAEEIEEEDLDEFSIEGEDFLKSDRSGFDEITTDKSISQADIGFDYAEEVVHLP